MQATLATHGYADIVGTDPHVRRTIPGKRDCSRCQKPLNSYNKNKLNLCGPCADALIAQVKYPGKIAPRSPE